MPNSTATKPAFDYAKAAQAILATLQNERDRQIVAQRYGLGLPKRHTLERIGSQFGITRERVRQIEKAATVRLRQSNNPALKQVDGILSRHLEEHGQVSRLDHVAGALGAETPEQQTYIVFLATLAPSIEFIEDSDHFHAAVAALPAYNKKQIAEITNHLVRELEAAGRPTSMTDLHPKLPTDAELETVRNIAHVSKRLAHLNDHWGLSHWPEVNPRSIRDKTYLVLRQHREPLHFTEIADRISGLGSRKRNVTVQAVHNELIKDPRFVLVGRGIYALREWGYTPGTVADVIAEVLRDESPLHKDEIVKRVLQRRQVKTTTIVLNLQEKDQFERVAKATYALKG